MNTETKKTKNKKPKNITNYKQRGLLGRLYKQLIP